MAILPLSLIAWGVVCVFGHNYDFTGWHPIGQEGSWPAPGFFDDADFGAIQVCDVLTPGDPRCSLTP